MNSLENDYINLSKRLMYNRNPKNIYCVIVTAHTTAAILCKNSSEQKIKDKTLEYLPSLVNFMKENEIMSKEEINSIENEIRDNYQDIVDFVESLPVEIKISNNKGCCYLT